jgi:hypothetical protein
VAVRRTLREAVPVGPSPDALPEGVPPQLPLPLPVTVRVEVGEGLAEAAPTPLLGEGVLLPQPVGEAGKLGAGEALRETVREVDREMEGLEEGEREMEGDRVLPLLPLPLPVLVRVVVGDGLEEAAPAPLLGEGVLLPQAVGEAGKLGAGEALRETVREGDREMEGLEEGEREMEGDRVLPLLPLPLPVLVRVVVGDGLEEAAPAPLLGDGVLLPQAVGEAGKLGAGEVLGDTVREGD